MTIEQITEEFDSKLKNGLQLTKRKGILTSTWMIQKTREFYYFFDIGEEFRFDLRHCYTLDDLLAELENDIFEIDMEVY